MISGSVLVVIVTYQSAGEIGDCLRAVERELASVSNASVVVVDNASADDTRAIARATLPAAKVIDTGANLGYSAAINRGVRAVDGADYVLVLNPDATVAPGALAALVSTVDGNSRVGVAVPRIVGPAGALALSIRRDPSLRGALAEALLGGDRAAKLGWGEIVAGDDSRYIAGGSVDWATGAAMLIARRCWDRVGLWDESFFLYSEETDYIQRVRRAGFECCYVPDAEVAHRGGESSTSPALWALMLSNKVKLYERQHSRASTLVYRGAILLGEAIRAVGGKERSRAAVSALAGRSRIEQSI